MACRENICLDRLGCGWAEWNNERVKVCPKCKKLVLSFSDEDRAYNPKDLNNREERDHV